MVDMVATRPENRLLRELAERDRGVFAKFVKQMEPYALQSGALLGHPRTVTDFSYFIESGIVSLVAATKNGSSVEVALIGREGVAGITDALGNQPLPYGLVVQIPGLSCSSLHELLMDYSQRVMHQLAQSALCNRFHTSEQRLARWLLLTAERADTNRFELTHDFVSQMVGAPRPVVSASASALREKGMIDYRRGVLTIRNAARLRRAACECVDAMSKSSNGNRA
jgi:CRP-like cAMP-binding protein